MGAATIIIQPDALLPLAGTQQLAGHHNTVMGMSVAQAAARVASIDYDGVWIVRDETTLEALATQQMNGRGRGIAFSPNGMRIAGLLALRPRSDTLYSYNVRVAEVSSGSTIAIAGKRVNSVAWTPDSEHLVVTGVAGFRIHHRTGTRVRDDESAKGWMAACVTADARHVYFISHGQLGCLDLGASHELPAPDVSPFAPPPGAPDSASDGLALSPTADRLTTGRFGGGLHVWDLATADRIAELRWDGPQVFRTKAVFAPDGGQLVASFHHVLTPYANGRVTHVLYDLRAQRVVGGTETNTPSTGFHSTACFSSDGRRLYFSEGHSINVCDLA
jgi:WD40 repeat protein